MFNSINQLVERALSEGIPLSEVMMLQEMEATGQSRLDIYSTMKTNLDTMEGAVAEGIEGVHSTTGLTGMDAVKMQKYIDSGKGLSGELNLLAIANAVSTNEVNAAMGKICATPTAGSAGVVPGVLFAMVKKDPSITEEQKIRFLFTSGAFGFVVANNASISGAAGGCQAEVGSASAMAAAALVELAGGTPEMSAHAFAIAMKNMLGLVCDPVAGLVEVPCVKRNAAGATNALTAADMALAGIESRIPADEVIEAMYKIGLTMPSALRETGRGGLAGTPTGARLKAELFGAK
ncbi:L-serine dehydratase [Jeotgalicoccus aerolatus]|uniref:L-serine dehydratase n=1 Tax=Jeotgalicoccus aerolatus TaxID=709510 RepID=A0A1G8WA19_9STAP|nr:L-serine ammonia-lyase, iron-sulfur-dependent, subunit alpha [Jeotgalicoccus aerolatus]NMA81736.1 L-serine ammonia-lyase, iron-sulfur-dependent, subunit alpha [Jeotgalicoccus aerolatus]SDJ74410.1 L-serine dehydratase [Jeotgalicoccus aerolatus]HJG33658.1 L-serine ammonia-lyase, iron-sulfur-dependent, subunit alpha [Jeotgalicoccus aerolatus]